MPKNHYDDTNLENPDEDLTGVDLIKYFINKRNMFQLKLPTSVLNGLNVPGVAEAIVDFHTRENMDYARKSGKLMKWIFYWKKGEKRRGRPNHSIETYLQTAPFVLQLTKFWIEKYGTLQPHNAFYVPDLTEGKEASIEYHRDRKVFFARICITLLGINAKKETLFKAKKVGEIPEEGAQIILKCPHGSVLIFDKHSSGHVTNVLHNTSVIEGNSMTCVIDLFLKRKLKNKNITLHDVVLEMIEEGIFEQMEINYRVP